MSITMMVQLLGLAMIAVGLWYLVSAVTTILMEGGGTTTRDPDEPVDPFEF
jgi:hypothetical protein